jgi:membrane protein
MRVRKRELFVKFQADRGTQLAAMIAYYALLAFVPLTFLTISGLALLGRGDESTYLVRELSRMFPESSVSTIVRAVDAIRSNSTVIGIIGLLVLLWSSLGLFGALESAFNIVYGRPNRPFFHGKGLAALLMIGLLVLLFLGLVAASCGHDQLSRHAPGVAGNGAVAWILSLVASALASFVFLFVSYYLLTNVPHTLSNVLPGAVIGTVVLCASFQVLPIYLDLAQGSPALQAFGGPVILLVWLYLMANVIVFGAEINWWIARRRELRADAPETGLADPA